MNRARLSARSCCDEHANLVQARAAINAAEPDEKYGHTEYPKYDLDREKKP